MAHLAAVPDSIDGRVTTILFIDHRSINTDSRWQSSLIMILASLEIFGLPFQGAWHKIGHHFHRQGAWHTIGPISVHPQTDGQTERVKRVVIDILHSVCAESPKTWSSVLPVHEFALSNAVHASTGFTPFYVNSHEFALSYAVHASTGFTPFYVNSRVPHTLPLRGSGLGGGEFSDKLSD